MAGHTHQQVIIINSQHFRVYTEPAIRLGGLDFNGEAVSGSYRHALNLLLNQTKKDNICHWLIYCGKGCNITTDDLYWTIEEVMPIVAQELNLQKIAIIESHDIFDRVNLMSLFETLSSISEVDIQFFEQERNARSWIQEK